MIRLRQTTRYKFFPTHWDYKRIKRLLPTTLGNEMTPDRQFRRSRSRSQVNVHGHIMKNAVDKLKSISEV